MLVAKASGLELGRLAQDIRWDTVRLVERDDCQSFNDQYLLNGTRDLW